MPAETTVEWVLSSEVDGGVVDMTIAEDRDVPGLLVVFVDTTPRRAMRVVLDERQLA